MSKVIEMQFPNKGEEYLDGRIHQIQPVELRRLNNSGEESYFLVYRDLTFSYDCCTTILTRRNNNFYKRPLDRYDEELYELLENSVPVDVEILGSRIELGSDLTMDSLISSVMSKPNDPQTLTSGSNNGSVDNTNDPLMSSGSNPNGGNSPAAASSPVPPNGGDGLLPPTSGSNPNGGDGLLPPTSGSNPNGGDGLLPPTSGSNPNGGDGLLPPTSDYTSSEENNVCYTEKENYVYVKVFGIASKAGDKIKIDYFSYDKKNHVSIQFYDESEGDFLYYTGVNKVGSIHATNNSEVFEEIVVMPISKNIDFMSINIANNSKNVTTTSHKTILCVTEILVNYARQFETSAESRRSINCLADSYFKITEDGYHWYGNDFTSKFNGFPTRINSDTKNRFCADHIMIYGDSGKAK